jgi:recombinational DNA repair protein (RecF pathway)
MMKKTKNECAQCHKPLNVFSIYIPDVGECCMECWRKHAKNVDGQKTVAKKVERDEV